MTTPRVRLGDLLVEAQIITREQLEEVLALQQKDGRRLGTLLVESGLVTETQVTQILSQQLSVPWVSLYHIDFSRQLLNLVPRDIADKHCLVPIFVRRVRGLGETLYVAMDDPSDESALAAVTQYSGLPVRAMIAPPSDIASAIRVYYGGRTRSASLSEAQVEAAHDLPAVDEDESGEEAAEGAEVEAASEPAEAEAAQAAGKEPDEGAEAAGKEPDEGGAEAGAAGEPGSEAEPVTLVKVKREAGDEPAAAEAAPPGPDPEGTAMTVRSSDEPPPDSSPQIEAHEISMPVPKKKGGARMITLTLLDGTQVNLPARPKQRAPSERPAASGDQLTARDFAAALRAVAHGADATEVLGDDVRWEAAFAALLSLLLKKHLIADWEFIDEYRKGG